MENATIGNQFAGLPMNDLIGAPLIAACNAQVQLAKATSDFIEVIGFENFQKGAEPKSNAIRTVLFKFDRPVSGAPGTQETVQLEVPMLSIVKVPNLFIDTVDITFDMEVKNSESEKSSEDKSATASANLKFGWGAFGGTAKISGSIAAHKENTRSSDQSAKYHVEIHARDNGMPEGLARVMDMIAQSIAPKQIEQTPPQPPVSPPDSGKKE